MELSVPGTTRVVTAQRKRGGAENGAKEIFPEPTAAIVRNVLNFGGVKDLVGARLAMFLWFSVFTDFSPFFAEIKFS